MGVANVADLVLRYVSVGEQIEAHEVTIPLTVNLVSADEAAAAGLDRGVTEEVVVLKSARAQEQARDHADRGEFEQARKILTESAEELRSMALGSEQADELLATAEMLSENSLTMSPAMYTADIKKQMRYGSRTTSQRRKPKTHGD